MTKYLKTKSEKTCYGCRACEQICKSGAIAVKPNTEGFLYPELDESRCVGCGLCARVCPYEAEAPSKLPIKAFAGQNKNTPSLMESTSGGAFSVLSDYILSEGGYVSGCIFDENFVAFHTVTNEKSVADRMRGSKYVQSDLKNVFSEIKELLDGGKTVLFSGTPCQVDGLKRFLLKDYGQLYTLALICHGVPSPRLLSDYLETVKKKHGEVTELIFRNKKKNGWCAQGTITYKGKIKSISPANNSYYNLYLQNAVSRKSCYECKYACAYGVGDITIGDFWGVEDVLPDFKYDSGVSALLVNTEKGASLLDAVSESITLRQAPLQSIVKNNGNLSAPSPLPDKREGIYQRIEKDGYDAVAKAECRYRYLKPFVSKIIPKKLKRSVKKLLRGRK